MTTPVMTPTVTTYLTAKGAADAIAFYKEAFGAVERYRLPNADGTVGHAEITIGDTLIMLSDEAPQLGVLSPQTLKGTPVAFVLSVPDVDAVFARAVAKGARVDRPIKDEPYGRGGWLYDPFGHRWSVMTPRPGFEPEGLR